MLNPGRTRVSVVCWFKLAGTLVARVKDHLIAHTQVMHRLAFAIFEKHCGRSCTSAPSCKLASADSAMKDQTYWTPSRLTWDS